MRRYPLISRPVNVMGVVFLFGARAEELDFAGVEDTTEFPDAKRCAGGDEATGRCERVKIEFEHESKII